MTEAITVMFIGRSGCGKGTQGKLLKEYLERTTGKEAIHVSTGDQMRAVLAMQNDTARLINEKIMQAGELAPLFLAVWAWGDIFIKNLSADKHLILDGTPRTALEAEMMVEALNFYERRRVYPIVLDIPKEEAVRRMLARGRADDTPENIESRLSFYKKQVAHARHILKWRYIAWGTFLHLSADKKSPEEIHQEILSFINQDWDGVPF